MNRDKVFGSDLNDPSPRMKGRLFDGLGFVVSPTNGLNPAKDAEGHKVPSVKNLPNK